MIANRRTAVLLVVMAAVAIPGCSAKVSTGDKPTDDRQRGTLLVDEKGSSDYAISPAGRLIVKSSGYQGKESRGLLIRSLDGKTFRPLVAGSQHPLASGAQWMGDRRVAFSDPGKSRDSRRSTLWVASLDGSAAEVPDAVLGGEDWESWTVADIVGATDDEIYFVAHKVIGSGSDLVSIRPDGSDRTVIVSDLYLEKLRRSDIEISPDGTRAVWTQENPDKKDFNNSTVVAVGALDGSDASVLGHGHEPAWSADSRSIVFLSNEGRKEKDGLPLLTINTAAADGSGKPKVQDGGYCCWAGRIQWIGNNTVVLADAAYVVGDGKLYAVTLK
ncbi:MAG: hypothetical protein ACJ71Z_02745 [Aeromicrobium sp.]